MNDSTLTGAKTGLKQKTLSGAAWISGGQVVQIITRFGVVVVLARLLTPSDFGLFALAVTILGICQIVVPLGTAAALVQLRDPEPSEIKAAFTISMMMATLLVPGAIVLGYAMERTSDMPGLALATLCLTPAIYFDAVSKIGSRVLETRMHFRATAVAALLGHFTGYGVVGVALAYAGFGWLALCCAEVASVAVSASYLLLVGRPQLGLNWDIPIWRRLVTFGAPLTVANLINWSSSNLPRVALGVLAGSTALGLYTRAADLSARFGSLADRLSGTVLYAAFCQRNDDMPRLARALCASTELALILVLPGSAILSALAEPIILLLFGSQWTGAVGAFRILAFLIPLLLLQRIALVMGHSLGRPGLAVKAYGVALVLSIIGSVIGIRYGLEGMAVALLIAVAGSSVLAVVMVSRQVGLPLSNFGASIVKGSLLTLGVFALCVVSAKVFTRLLGSLNALEEVAVIVLVAGGLLMLVWSVGQRWLFSQPARALIFEARRKLGQRVRRERQPGTDRKELLPPDVDCD
jgi:O-antigen/teichoic acid export membrane protein